MTCSTSSPGLLSNLSSTGRRRAAPWTRALAALALLVVLAPSPAHADKAADRRFEASVVLAQHANGLLEAKVGDFERFRDDASACRNAVQDGTAAGLKPTDEFETNAGPRSWSDAGVICDEYARLQPMYAAIGEVDSMLSALRTIYANGKGIEEMRGDAYRNTVETAKACVAAVDQRIKDGAPSDVAFATVGERVTLVEVRKRCHDFIAWGERAGAAVDAEEKAAEAVLRAKYAKHGITGDRLKYLMESDHRIVRGKGCKILDFAGKRKAAVLYEMSEGDTYWVVYKMTFKGDRLVGTTERRFSKLTSNGWTCK